MLGVSNLERSVVFYESVLGFDRLLYEFQGYIPEMETAYRGPIANEAGHPGTFPARLPTAGFLPAGAIKLFEVPEYEGKHIYQGRRWGDIGCMELGLDVSNLEVVVADIKAKGVEVYLPPVEIDMGSGSKGMIAYIRDPDGTIIELVEVKTVAWLSLPTFMRFAIPFLKAYDRLAGIRL